jgi:SEC-C motif domain protein
MPHIIIVLIVIVFQRQNPTMAISCKPFCRRKSNYVVVASPMMISTMTCTSYACDNVELRCVQPSAVRPVPHPHRTTKDIYSMQKTHTQHHKTRTTSTTIDQEPTTLLKIMLKCRATVVWLSVSLIHWSHCTTASASTTSTTTMSTTSTLAFATAPQNRKSSSIGAGGSSSKSSSNDKKKKKKKGTTIASGNGFGIAPPTYDEVIRTFKTRIPPNANELPCPCGSSTIIMEEKGENSGQQQQKRRRLYNECCGPLHRGEQACQTMTDVLKSRYSAFSWRMIDHIIHTTHSTNRDYQEDPIAWAKNLNRNGMFDSYEFIQLQAGIEELNSNDSNEGFIEFQVTLKDKGDKDLRLRGKETVVKERSRFLRNPIDGVWSYASGQVRTDVAGLEDTILNN